MFILKQALKDKIAKRIHVHPTYDDLQKHIPKEILPKDYGGDETSVTKIAGKLQQSCPDSISNRSFFMYPV